MKELDQLLFLDLSENFSDNDPNGECLSKVIIQTRLSCKHLETLILESDTDPNTANIIVEEEKNV